MADLPSIEQVTTGGIVASIIGACGWLFTKLRTAVEDGETLAERRIAALTSDFNAYRARVELDQAATEAELLALRSEVADYRAELARLRAEHESELAETRDALRMCKRETHRCRLEIDRLTGLVQHLGGDAV